MEERKPWYIKLFENYAENYDKQEFTKGTAQEAGFIDNFLGNKYDAHILDIGCGTGRHSIELARLGYKNITGVDISEAQLNRAIKKADEVGANVNFVQSDARYLPYHGNFDVVIMLCEGGFSIMETDEMNYKILESATRALKAGGTFIFSCLNVLFPLFHTLCEKQGKADEHSNAKITFDLLTFRDHAPFVFTDDDGHRHKIMGNERFYAPSEIHWLLKSLGFDNIVISSGKPGNYSASQPLNTHDIEMLVTATKTHNLTPPNDGFMI